MKLLCPDCCTETSAPLGFALCDSCMRPLPVPRALPPWTEVVSMQWFRCPRCAVKSQMPPGQVLTCACGAKLRRPRSTWNVDSRSHPPQGRLIKTSRDAELVACAWMRHWGYSDAACTPDGPDMGIDVISSEALAQVKLEGRPVSRPTLQQFEGAAVVGGQRRRLFFSLSGYTAEAEAYAESVGMALFEFDYQGVPRPINMHAIEVIHSRTGAERGHDLPGS